MGNDRTAENDLHEISCITDRSVARPEEAENGVQQQQTYGRKKAPLPEKLSNTTLPNTPSAASRRPCPSRIEVSAAAPIPINDPKADAMFIRGIESATPEMAIGPTPCPMKMLSTML